MEELYINDKKVDLGNATITLNHKNNLLGDITTINASNSQTIKLPKTVRNREILDCPDQPSYSGKYLRKYINARYFRNGIEILKGFAVLLSSSDTYEICLSWGELFELTEFLNEGDTLNEYLDDGESVYWDENLHRFKDSPYSGFYDNGLNDLSIVAPHPSVFVSEILQKIQDKSGLVFKFPQETTNWLADKKVLCTTRLASKKQTEKQTAEFRKDEVAETEFINLKQLSLLYTQYNYAIEADLEQPDNYIKIDEELAELRIKPNVRIVFKSETTIHVNFVIFDDRPENGGKKINELPFIKIDGKTYKLANTTLVITNTTGSYYFYLDFVNKLESVETISFDMSVDISFKDNVGAVGEIPYPGYFPPYINLLDISLADFIKNISALTGTFPHRYKSDATNVITFSSLEIIYQNKSKGIDWSDKLVFRGYPKEVSYKVNDMARKNYLLYKEDEQVPTRASGIIEVNDETLEREKDLFEMVFSASDMSNNIAKILQYEKNGNEVNEISVASRILSSFDGDMKYLSFSGMSFSDIVKTRYQGYQRIMREPIVLKEDFRLTELDIKNIDFTIPIFLKQYGRYYAVMSIQDTNGICNVELLQLN